MPETVDIGGKPIPVPAGLPVAMLDPSTVDAMGDPAVYEALHSMGLRVQAWHTGLVRGIAREIVTVADRMARGEYESYPGQERDGIRLRTLLDCYRAVIGEPVLGDTKTVRHARNEIAGAS